MQRWGISGFVGRSRLLRRILSEIERLHQFAGTNVLITGESGTGKELVARAIHCSSPRASAPFIPVNCVAIPGELAESLLFGHTRGSFTGAFTDRKGWFELADGGTLFLDEIGDMPPALQAKMLRVLEDGQVVPVGASHPKRVDVRVVAATNADLQERIASGAFREDLYFRLARYLVEMPPLRDRVEDIGLLADHFLTLFATEMGVPKPPLTPRALALLESHTFPGNVRELKNVIERALIESAGRPIEPSHLRLIGARAASGSGGRPRRAVRGPALEPRSGRTGADQARAAGDRRQRGGGGAAPGREPEPHLQEIPSYRELRLPVLAGHANWTSPPPP